MKSRILILGINGMLGHKLFEFLSLNPKFEIFGTIRDSARMGENIIQNINAFDITTIDNIISKIKPDIIVNCIGIIKQSSLAHIPKVAIYINSYFPHLLNDLCQKYDCRLIQISTDCVFDGLKGNYCEKDNPTPLDLYGRTKLLGEVNDNNSLTIRTSIIGHELQTKSGLLEWFLSQEQSVKGYKNAIFSGFPTIELSKILADLIIPNQNIAGIYHIASNPIDKFSLLELIKTVYKKSIEINADSDFYCNRSLNPEKFNNLTGYYAPNWEILINEMYIDFKKNESI
jgi:dTDP-4-dehydrorhamnose reductase